nr:NADH dehydrogenase subunit 6 [Aviostivalius klossi bispiniformis]
MMLKIGMLFSYMFIFMDHPLSLGFMLMIQTLWISMFIGIMSKTFWFSYILFITFLGGMLILFIYMTSLTNNEKFSFSWKLLWGILLMTICNMNYPLLNLNLDSYKNDMIQFNNLNILNKLYSFPNNLITLMMIIYLLISMIVVIKISNKFMGPMRMNF